MEAIKTQESDAKATLGLYTNQGIARVVSKTVTVNTNERTELINLTDDVRAFVEAAGIEDGYVQVSSLHTTAALFINEWQDALLTDIKSLIERVVPKDTYYRHNDPEYSDCDRHNAHAHLRNIILGLSLTVPISQGKLVLGRWQSLILAEFDGPNQRRVFLQAFGV
jgi:secondary thiamine-phosphate synthase enzyme